jgi:Flp pilus assembly protein TadB
MHPEYVDLLTKHPKGATLITGAVVMGTIGILWIRKLVRIDV